MLTTTLAGAGVLVGTTIGAAQAPADPSWNCRASLVRADQGLTTLLGIPSSPIEPLIANGKNSETAPDNASCAPDSQSAQEKLDATPLTVLGNVLQAQTSVDPGTSAPRNARTNTATTSAEKLSVLVDGAIPGGALVTADTIQSTATASCVGGQPTLTGTSQIVGLKIAGQSVPVDDVFAGVQTITDSPLGEVVRVYANRQEKSPDGSSLTQTALRVEVLAAAAGQLGKPLATVVLGETKVSSQNGNACDPEPPPPTVTTTVPGTTTTVPGPTQTVPGPTQTVPGPTQTVPGPTQTQTQTKTVTVPATTVTGAGTKTVPNGTNASRCARLTMYFAKNRKRALGVKFGRERVVTRGRIVNCNGKSIVRARIDVYHILPNGKKLVKTGLRSRALGRMTLILPRNLFTRKLRFEYRPDLNSSKVATRRTLQINVRDRKGKLIKKAPKGQGKPRF